jgi:hypothetical protein
MQVPTSPDFETCNRALSLLGDLIAAGGADRFLLPPVEPSEAAFPEPWRATTAGVTTLLRRLIWHAGIERDVAIDDQSHGAPPTERKPSTRVELAQVGPKAATFVLGFLGEDDIPGTLAHEIGVLFAALHRPGERDPYRAQEVPAVPGDEPQRGNGADIEIEADRDLERGSIATVYLGLGVLSANAAFQQYSRQGRFIGVYAPLEYDVLRAGYASMSVLAYLLAVQAIVRGTNRPSAKLGPPQRDEVTAWIDVLRGQQHELRERLGIPLAATSDHARPEVVAFEDAAAEPSSEDTPRRNAFRWRTNRGGVGALAGTVFGVGASVLIASRSLSPWVMIGAAGAGHLFGRRVQVPRCSGCSSVVGPTAELCRHCGARLRGDIAHLSDRLEAEERLEEEPR